MLGQFSQQDQANGGHRQGQQHANKTHQLPKCHQGENHPQRRQTDAFAHQAWVSVEMLEAVGERFWPGYFAQLRARLKPGGCAVVQTITIADALFANYRKGTDFIQRYVFPGGMLPSPAVVNAQARRAGLEVAGDLAFGLDYVSRIRCCLPR